MRQGDRPDPIRPTRTSETQEQPPVTPFQGDETVHLDTWDLGDVLAIVEQPETFSVPEKSWNNAGAVEVAAKVAEFAVPAAPLYAGAAAAGAALVILVARGAQQSGPARPPHVVLLSINDARALIAQDTL